MTMSKLNDIQEEISNEYYVFKRIPKEIHVTASEWSVLVDEIYESMYKHSGPPMDILEMKTKRGRFGNLFGIPLFVDDDPA
jgi:hypothetical protein